MRVRPCGRNSRRRAPREPAPVPRVEFLYSVVAMPERCRKQLNAFKIKILGGEGGNFDVNLTTICS